MWKKLGSVIAGLLLLVGIAAASSSILYAPTVLTATVTTANVLRSPNQGSVTVVVYTTAISGVASIVPSIQGVDVSGNLYTLCTGNAIAATGVTNTISVGTALTPASGVACSMPLPDLWNVKLTFTGAGGNTLTTGVNANTAM